MSPQIINIGISLLQTIIKEAPHVWTELQILFGKEMVTDEDWAALRAKITAKTFEQLAPDAKLPPEIDGHA